MLDNALERPWHLQPEAEALPEAWLDEDPEQAEEIEPLSEDDEAGSVSGLVHSEAHA